MEAGPEYIWMNSDEKFIFRIECSSSTSQSERTDKSYVFLKSQPLSGIFKRLANARWPLS